MPPRKLTAIEVNGTYYSGAQARDLRGLGEGGARRLRLRAQGVALLHQPQGAGRGGRIDRSASPGRGSSNSATEARADPVAVHGDQEVRRGRFRRVPEAAARQAGRRRAAPRGPGPARQFPRARIRRDVPRGGRRDRLSPIRPNIRRSPTSPATSSMRGWKARSRTSRRGYSPAALDRWADGGEGLGRRASAPDGLPYVGDAARRRRRATPSSSSSTARRCARRPRRMALIDAASSASAAICAERSPGSATRPWPMIAAALEHVERLARVDIALARRRSSRSPAIAPGSLRDLLGRRASTWSGVEHAPHAREPVGRHRRRRVARVDDDQAAELAPQRAAPAVAAPTAGASCGAIASSPSAQILERHRLARRLR